MRARCGMTQTSVQLQVCTLRHDVDLCPAASVHLAACGHRLLYSCKRARCGMTQTSFQLHACTLRHDVGLCPAACRRALCKRQFHLRCRMTRDRRQFRRRKKKKKEKKKKKKKKQQQKNNNNNFATIKLSYLQFQNVLQIRRCKKRTCGVRVSLIVFTSFFFYYFLYLFYTRRRLCVESACVFNCSLCVVV